MPLTDLLDKTKVLPRFIRKIWSVDNSSPFISKVTQPMVFDGCFELIISCNNGFSMIFDHKTLSYNSGIYLGGQITQPMSLALKPNTSLLFLKLEHGFLSHITRQNMVECNNQSIELSILNRKLYNILLPLLDGDKWQKVISDLQDFFSTNHTETQLFSALACKTLANQLDYSKSKQRLQQEWGMSTRKFERQFKRSTGLNPKTFADLSRMRQITEALQFMQQTTTLTELALDNGFYDQAHFIKAMRRFIGTTPGKIDFEQFFIPRSSDKVRFFTI